MMAHFWGLHCLGVSHELKMHSCGKQARFAAWSIASFLPLSWAHLHAYRYALPSASVSRTLVELCLLFECIVLWPPQVHHATLPKLGLRCWG
jgi:hypothetical protein